MKRYSLIALSSMLFISNLMATDSSSDNIINQTNGECPSGFTIDLSKNLIENGDFSILEATGDKLLNKKPNSWLSNETWKSDAYYQANNRYPNDEDSSTQTIASINSQTVEIPGIPHSGIAYRFIGNQEYNMGKQNYLYTNGNDLGRTITSWSSKSIPVESGVPYVFVSHFSNILYTNLYTSALNPKIKLGYNDGNWHDLSDKFFEVPRDTSSKDNESKDRWYKFSYLINPSSDSLQLRVRDNAHKSLRWGGGAFGDDLAISGLGLYKCVPSNQQELVAEYRFDECEFENGKVKDSSENELHAGVVNSIKTSDDGQVGRSANFKNNQYISIADNEKLNPNTITVMAWIKPKKFESWDSVVLKANNGSWVDGWGLFHGNSTTNDIRFYVGKWDNEGVVKAEVKMDEYSFVVGSYDGKEVKIYVNGELIDTKPLDPKFFKASTAPVRIGSAAGDYHWNGNIDEVKIYKGAISADEIKNIYDNEKAGKNADGTPRESVECGSQLVAEYRFDECEFENGVVKESSGTNKDAKASENVEPIERGIINNAAYITNGNIEVNNLGEDFLDDNKFVSVSMWIKWDGKDNVMPLSWGEKDGYNLYITKDNIGFNSWNGDVYGTSNSVIKDKEWHHIVAIFYNSDVTKSKLYIDSQSLDLEYKSNKRSSSNRNHTDKHLFIGSSSDKTYDFKGNIDEVKIYNGLLSEDTIQNIHQNESIGKDQSGEERESVTCGTPFNCTAESLIKDNNSYIFTSNKNDEFTQSLSLNVATKDISVDKDKFAKTHINAIGMNPVDGFIYGWAAGKEYKRNHTTKKGYFLKRDDAHLVKIDKDYNVYRVNLDGELVDSNTRFYLADIDNDGIFYMSNMFEADYTTYNLKQIRRVDLNSRKVLSTVDVKYPSSYSDPKDPRRVKCADYAIHPIDGKLYMINSNQDSSDNNRSINQLVRVDPTTGEFEELGYIGDINDTYSAFSFFDKYGNFYFETRAASMYKIDISEPWNGKNNTKSKAKFFQTLIDDDFKLDSSDGARCSRSPMADKPLVEIIDSQAKESEKEMSFTINADRVLGSGSISCTVDSVNDENIISSYKKITYNKTYEGLNDKNLTINIELQDDNRVEDNEEFIITCSSNDLYFINKDNNATGLIIDDDEYIFDAFDTAARKIRTKIVNQEFTLEIAAIDSANNIVDIKDMNNTKIKIVDSLKCATKLEDLNATGLDDFNASKKEYSFTVNKATKSATVQFYWENKFGSQVSCSSDDFAIRPKAFSFTTGMSSNLATKAGADLNISIFALDESNNKTVNYNEDESSFKVDINQTNTHCDFNSSDFSKSNMDRFRDGELNATISYNDVGELKINISEIIGQEFAIVDKDDTTNDNDRLISPANRVVAFKPDRFEIVKSFKNSSSSDKSYAFYSNSDLANSPTWSLVIKALNKNADVTKNYNSECVAHDVDVTFSFDIDSYASSSQSLTMRKAVDTNSSFSFDSNITSSNITKDIDLVVTKDKFVDGKANNSLTLNFKRDKLIALHPAKVTLKDIDSIDKVDSDVNATLDVDDSVTYKYMRAYIQDPIEVIGKDELNTKVYYEAYDLGGLGKSSKSGESGWKVVDYDSTSKKMKFFNERTRYGNDRVEISNENNQTLNVKAKKVPESNKVTMDLDDDFKYITDTISTNVSFSPDSANWAGEGKVGMMVDTNVSRRTKFKRMDW